ncbi:integrin alpha E2-like protein [Streptomyces noursei]|nr:integrin alpha E2-like protein [Streptomyces noursei]
MREGRHGGDRGRRRGDGTAADRADGAGATGRAMAARDVAQRTGGPVPRRVRGATGSAGRRRRLTHDGPLLPVCGERVGAGGRPVPDAAGAVALRAGRAVGGAVRHPLRRARVPRRGAEQPGDRRLRRRLPPVAARGGGRPGHGGLAARTAVVHRGAGDDRAQLPGVRAVGPGRGTATGTAGHGGADRIPRPPSVLPRRRRAPPAERAGVGHGDGVPAPRVAPLPAGRTAASAVAARGAPGGTAVHVVRPGGRTPLAGPGVHPHGRERPVLARRVEGRGPGPVDGAHLPGRRVAGRLPRPEHRAVPAAAPGGLRDDAAHRVLDARLGAPGGLAGGVRGEPGVAAGTAGRGSGRAADRAGAGTRRRRGRVAGPARLAAAPGRRGGPLVPHRGRRARAPGPGAAAPVGSSGTTRPTPPRPSAGRRPRAAGAATTRPWRPGRTC